MLPAHRSFTSSLACFEKLLVTQLRRRIDLHIPREQFGFMKVSSTSDAGVLLASTITTAIYQRAEARLVALDIKGAFDSVWWRGGTAGPPMEYWFP